MDLNFGALLKYKVLALFKHKKMKRSKPISTRLQKKKLRLLLTKHKMKPEKLSVHYKLQLVNNMLLKRKLRRQKRRRKNKPQNKQRKQPNSL